MNRIPTTVAPGMGGDEALRREVKEAEAVELERGLRRSHGRGAKSAN